MVKADDDGHLFERGIRGWGDRDRENYNIIYIYNLWHEDGHGVRGQLGALVGAGVGRHRRRLRRRERRAGRVGGVDGDESVEELGEGRGRVGGVGGGLPPHARGAGSEAAIARAERGAKRRLRAWSEE